MSLDDFDPDGGSSTDDEQTDAETPQDMTDTQHDNAAKDDNDDSELADSESDDVDEVVERRDVGASMSVDITRGTGTRDQEKWSLEGKGKDAEAAIDELKTQLESVVGPLNDDDAMAEQMRSFQPSNEPSDND